MRHNRQVFTETAAAAVDPRVAEHAHLTVAPAKRTTAARRCGAVARLARVGHARDTRRGRRASKHRGSRRGAGGWPSGAAAAREERAAWEILSAASASAVTLSVTEPRAHARAMDCFTKETRDAAARASRSSSLARAGGAWGEVTLRARPSRDAPPSRRRPAGRSTRGSSPARATGCSQSKWRAGGRRVDDVLISLILYQISCRRGPAAGK